MREAKKATNPDCKPTQNKKTFADIESIWSLHRSLTRDYGYADHWQKIPKPCLAFLLFVFLWKEGEKGKKQIGWETPNQRRVSAVSQYLNTL